MILMGQFESARQALSKAVDSAYRGNPDGRLKAGLDADYRAANATLTFLAAGMSGFVGAAATGADWVGLLNSHQDWLIARSETGVPFRREAEEFAQIYHANKARYGNVHLSKASAK